MEKAFECDLCSEELDSRDKLNAHIERQHEQDRESKRKRFECSVCGKKFSTGQNLTNHIRTHTGERPFKCQVTDCSMTFNQKSTLKDHIKFKHHDERPFACAYSGCNFRVKIKSNLSQHTATVHSESKTLSCSKCEYRTNIAGSLSRHMIVHEGKPENIPCTIDGCKYKGKNSEALKGHMRRHKTILPCPVSGCGQYVTTKEAMKNHLKLHNSSGRSFQCPLCFKHFPTMEKLKRHCVVHTNEKPFQCGHCKHEAAIRANVKAHISSVHAAIEFPYVVHLLDDRECLRCKVILPSAEFVVHCEGHGEPVLMT